MGRRWKIGVLFGLLGVAAAAAYALSNGISLGAKVEIHSRREARGDRMMIINDTIAVCRYLRFFGVAEIRIPADGVDNPCRFFGPAS